MPAVIALLGLGAVVLAIEILSGSSTFDPTVPRTLQLAAALALFVPLTAAGLNLAAQRIDLAPVGRLAVLIVLIAFAVVAVSIWSDEFFLFGDPRAAIYATLTAISVAQVSVLLTFARSEDPSWIRILRGVTIVALGILVALTIHRIASGNGGDLKDIALTAVVYGFGTVSLFLYGTSRSYAETRSG